MSNIFLTFFDNFFAAQKTSKIVKKCQNYFRQFSCGTSFPAPFGRLWNVEATTTQGAIYDTPAVILLLIARCPQRASWSALPLLPLLPPNRGRGGPRWAGYSQRESGRFTRFDLRVLIRRKPYFSGEDGPRVSSRWQISRLAVKNVVKFSVTNLKPFFPGEAWQNICHQNPRHSSLPKFQNSSPWTSGTARV